MCGISGWLALGGDRPEETLQNNLLSAMRHRGPDDTGVYRDGPVSLGMTRLAINDVEGGHQPYFSEDRSVVAIFNGEIYNFRALRARLEELGHRLTSKTDGEVIVHLWEEFGPDFVHQLNGMFAIALWDGTRLHLFRDRMGIKPLYYTVCEGVFYFASELKCLVEVPGFSRRLNHRALRSYLTLEYVPSPHCIFEESAKLAPGHSLTVGPAGAGEPRRYWEFPRFQPVPGRTFEQWATELDTLLTESVSRRLIADVPLGVFLSGGLDSSTITALMSELQPGQVKSFSVGFEEVTFDESSHSRTVAESLGTEHHEQILSPQTTLEVIEPLYARLDEPLADPALIPTYLLSRFARREVTVALAGEGADELLGGYPTYFAHQVSRPFNHLPPVLLDLLRWMVGKLPTSRNYLSFDFKVKRFCSGLGLPDVERHLTWMGAIPWHHSESFLLHPHPQAWEAPRGLDSLGVVEKIQSLDFQTYLSEDLLVKLDRATMLTSLEGRVPFLDHTLVEAMASLPTRFKLRGLDAKRVLKRGPGSRVPESIRQRKKKGFGIPVADWLRGPLKFLLDEFLNPTFLKSQGLFKTEPVTRLVTEHLEGKADHRKPLWTLLVFQRWWSQYNPS